MKKKINSILGAFRIKTLPSVLGPLLIALSISIIESFELYKIILVILIGISLQVLVNLINDLEDYKKGVDNLKRLGPARATQSGDLSIYEMKILISFIFLISLLLGILAFFMSGIFVIFFGILLFILAYTYTGGPSPYGYMGLGEFAVFIVFGPFTVLGSLYLFDLYPSFETILISFVPGFSSSLIILVNNIRDIKNDEENGKKTIAVKLGDTRSRYLYIFILYLLILNICFLVFISQNLILLLLVILCIVIFPISDIGFKKSWFILPKYYSKISLKESKLNNTLINTVKAHFIICTIISISIIAWEFSPIF